MWLPGALALGFQVMSALSHYPSAHGLEKKGEFLDCMNMEIYYLGFNKEKKRREDVYKHLHEEITKAWS